MDQERRRTEEDLSTGPTPEIREAEGEPPAPDDISEGPTPEVREVEREADREGPRRP